MEQDRQSPECNEYNGTRSRGKILPSRCFEAAASVVDEESRRMNGQSGLVKEHHLEEWDWRSASAR